MSEIKVNKITPRAACGTTQLGDSGDTFTIPSGATINNQGTAVNFGATGSASWVTTVKTSTFTAVAGEGYFINTTGGVVSVNLPAGTAGAVVAVKDYANTFDTNNVTLVQNGSDKIGGSTVNGTLSTEGIAVTLVFIDSTQGWLVTDSGLQSESPTELYVTATGGCITTCGNFKMHTFTGPGTFQVTCAGNVGGSSTVDYLVVAGAGGGGGGEPGYWLGGGGGAGGYRESPGTASGCYSVSPLGTSPAVALSVPVASYAITVGGGGAGGVSAGPMSATAGTSGSNAIFSSITSTGGGGGGRVTGCGSAQPCKPGKPGGSGGGSGGGGGCAAGTGNTPLVTPPQGNTGGVGSTPPAGVGGTGGGATAVGSTWPHPGTQAGGAGATTSITASAVTRAVGGGLVAGGSPTAGGVNTGTGGSSNSCGCNAAAGGSGVVVIRYKYQ